MCIRDSLREAEDGCRDLLVEYRNGLDLIARALLEHESINGDEVYRLLQLSGADIKVPQELSLTAAAAGDTSDVADEPSTPQDTVEDTMATPPPPPPQADLETAE